MENEAPLPRPIDNGQVDQTMVEYTGERLGAVTFRGPSGRKYPFDASPWHRRQYVLAEDLEHFRRFPDFRVLEETWIDPEAEKFKAMEATIGDRVVEAVRRILLSDGGRKRRRTPRS